MTRETQAGWDCSCSSERILHEPGLAMPGPLPEAGVWRAVFRRVLSTLRTEVQIKVRTGYQDETGFHNGVKPAENEIQWPPVW